MAFVGVGGKLAGHSSWLEGGGYMPLTRLRVETWTDGMTTNCSRAADQKIQTQLLSATWNTILTVAGMKTYLEVLAFLKISKQKMDACPKSQHTTKLNYLNKRNM